MDKFIRYAEITTMIVVTLGTLLITYLLLTNVFGFLSFDSDRLGPTIKIKLDDPSYVCLIEADENLTATLINEDKDDDKEEANDEENNEEKEEIITEEVNVEVVDSYARYKILPVKQGHGSIKFVIAKEVKEDTANDDNSEVADENIASNEVKEAKYETINEITYTLDVTKVGFNTLCANIVQE